MLLSEKENEHVDVINRDNARFSLPIRYRVMDWVLGFLIRIIIPVTVSNGRITKNHSTPFISTCISMKTASTLLPTPFQPTTLHKRKNFNS